MTRIKRWLGTQLYRIGYCMCDVGLKMRGIDFVDFQLWYARKLAKEKGE